jgi:hypothetical protein
VRSRRLVEQLLIVRTSLATHQSHSLDTRDLRDRRDRYAAGRSPGGESVEYALVRAPNGVTCRLILLD